MELLKQFYTTITYGVPSYRQAFTDIKWGLTYYMTNTTGFTSTDSVVKHIVKYEPIYLTRDVFFISLFALLLTSIRYFTTIYLLMVFIIIIPYSVSSNGTCPRCTVHGVHRGTLCTVHGTQYTIHTVHRTHGMVHRGIRWYAVVYGGIRYILWYMIPQYMIHSTRAYAVLSTSHDDRWYSVHREAWRYEGMGTRYTVNNNVDERLLNLLLLDSFHTDLFQPLAKWFQIDKARHFPEAAWKFLCFGFFWSWIVYIIFGLPQYRHVYYNPRSAFESKQHSLIPTFYSVSFWLLVL